ncbi:MAG: SDR family oxidoreductase [Bacilli bacterium]|nr:SDR family oxidoreductase [Bacilli bacterium]MDD4547439.1 SDR family oxidoreductase [Bacilli bacterium]
MKALITGASSGIGADMARVLYDKGYELILVARDKKNLEAIKKELGDNVKIISMDISSTFNCMKLYNRVKKEKIDILINNAGFGVFGDFSETNLDRELDMIDLNIKAVHTLTKMFLKDFKERDSGYILNVASTAAFLSGPLMATYYATKGYVLKLTEAIYEELRHEGSNVYIGALCPGPVNTNFNNVAGVQFSVKAMESKVVAEYAINKMMKRKLIIIPGFFIKLGVFMTRILPRKLLLKINYKIQKEKEN